MHILQNISIKHKQTFIVVLTSGVALLLACGAFAFYELTTFRSAMVQNLSTLAEIIGSNTSAALDFADPKAAGETLTALRAQPHVVAACLYTANGTVFAFYRRPGDSLAFPPAPLRTDGFRFDKDSLQLFMPVLRNGEHLGTLFVVSDLNDLYLRLDRYALIAVVVFFVSGLAAILISSQLQELISVPILNLVKTARAVTVEKNYSVRAVKQGNDELGVLIDAFNEMLRQIQERDVALQKSHVELEKRVTDRTEELVHSLSLLRATLESTTDGILVTDAAGHVTSVNEKFAEIWGIPYEVVIANSQTHFSNWVFPLLKDPLLFLEKFNTLLANPELESFDLLEFKNGKFVERYSKPQRVEEKSIGRVWSFRDVTERTLGEEAMTQMHKQLLVTSRQAGMAEVATSVLHNVGNVLNSINVSSTLVSDSVKKSKITSLSKVAAALEEHRDDLGAYLTTNPQGSKLTDFIGHLAEHLRKEQGTVLQELTLLHHNIEHVKDIVVMQQSYARISGLVESVNIVDLIEDALRLNGGALQRHKVAIVREYNEVLQIDVEKHKVLQILVNLIRNAKYACDDSFQEDKVVTLGVRMDRTNVIVSVADNGVGIPAENLIRIFSHGFTTRKEGHGFGLHSAALAAVEMGGSLRVESDGIGAGATFTLELPFRAQEPSAEMPQQRNGESS